MRQGYPVLLLGGLLAGGCAELPLEGLEALSVALEAPERLEFGWIPLGEEVLRRFTIRNVGASPLEMEAVVFEPGFEGGYALTAAIVDPVIGPGDEEVIEVRLRADALLPDRALGILSLRVAGLAEDDARLPNVSVWAKVSPSGLAVEPNPLTIGPVPYLETWTATIGLRNLTRAPLEVRATRASAFRAQYEEVVTRGAFGVLPRVDGRRVVTTLAPGEVFNVPISYTSPGGPGEAKEQALWRVATCAEEAACSLDIVIQGLPDHDGPVAEVRPSGVFFNQIPVGEEVEAELTIANPGRRTLRLSDLRYQGSPDFSVDVPLEAAIEPDRFLLVPIRYRPDRVGADNGEILFSTNDPLQREVRVRTAGAGVILPPCDIEVAPTVVDFGRIEVFERSERTVLFTNRGRSSCLLFEPRIVADSGTQEGVFGFLSIPPISITLDPGRSWVAELRFAPARPGPQGARLVLRSSGPQPIEVRLQGDTPEGVNIACTRALSTEPGAAVTLTAAVVGGTARRYAWRVREAPNGGASPSWAFRTDATRPSVEFVPLRLGIYVVDAEVETDAGEVLECSVEVEAESSGLTATLTWDGPGDLDLHLHRGARTPWFGPEDCHYDNLRPTWVRGATAASGPNPAHSGDDTSGDGPETIRIETPELGVVYTLAISHFERAEGRSATVELRCGQATAALLESSRPFRGRESGSCSGNDFWTVASFVFTAPDQCTVTALDTYRPAREACRSY